LHTSRELPAGKARGPVSLNLFAGHIPQCNRLDLRNFAQSEAASDESLHWILLKI
jgi:hypothetical protein